MNGFPLSRDRRRRIGWRSFLSFAASVLIWPLMSAGAIAAAEAEKAGDPPAAAPAGKPAPNAANAHLIPIPVPIESNIDSKVRASVAQVLAKSAKDGSRPIIVFEFSAGQSDGRGSDFGRAHDLAKFIATSPELNGVKTVAYIPRSIKGHAVLVAMACEEIIMAPDARIGEAGIDEPDLGPTIRSGYKEIAEARRTIPTAIALGMLDKELSVLKVDSDVGTDYILSTDLDEFKKKHAVQKAEELSPRPGFYSGQQARTELRFVSYLADDRQKVALALGLPPGTLRADPSLENGWRPVQVPIKSVMSPALAQQTIRKIKEQVENNNVNFVCIWIESAGGDPDSSLELANYLAELNNSKVRTVAYIPNYARGDAAWVALACDEIVMGPGAALGGPGEHAMRPQDIAAVRTGLKTFLKEKQVSWSLPVAMVDPELKVFRCTNKNTAQKDSFSEEELNDLPDKGAWSQGELLTTNNGEPLQLTGDRAEKLEIASHTVDSFKEFKKLYGLENDIALVEPGWADFLISALSAPEMLGFLLFLGLAGIIVEVYAPGHGIGGFIALLSFMLYFWIQHLHGTAGWLEVLLFIAGVGCLLLEIFVLPGFAIFGLGGGLMIIASLVLASQTFLIPRNDYQMEQMKNTALMISGAIVGAAIAAVVFRRYLPRTPGISHILLEPPSESEREQIATRESLVDFSDLLGQRGVTTTPLMPSGKARFNGRLVDVVARSGDVIDRGVEVMVAEVRGNHVVVQPA
jgi:membrane-bound serine protease (ClpP class)